MVELRTSSSSSICHMVFLCIIYRMIICLLYFKMVKCVTVLQQGTISHLNSGCKGRQQVKYASLQQTIMARHAVQTLSDISISTQSIFEGFCYDDRTASV